MKLKLRPPVDGWRRGASLCLKEETARFVLSAFGLDVFSTTAGRATPSRSISKVFGAPLGDAADGAIDSIALSTADGAVLTEAVAAASPTGL